MAKDLYWFLPKADWSHAFSNTLLTETETAFDTSGASGHNSYFKSGYLGSALTGDIGLPWNLGVPGNGASARRDYVY